MSSVNLCITKIREWARRGLRGKCRGEIAAGVLIAVAIIAIALLTFSKFPPGASAQTSSANAQTAALNLPTSQNPVIARILDPDGSETGLQPLIVNANNQLQISVPEPKSAFRPGKYKLELWIWQNGTIYYTENDFTWGVLAVNFNKSVYNLGDSAKIGFGVLDDKGKTICDAALDMTITSPSGRVSNFRTEPITGSPTSLGSRTSKNLITRSSSCGPNTITNNPDYAAATAADEAGTYSVSVTATTANGARQLADSFEVQNPPLFDVERLAPTRIFPPGLYETTLRVKANADYTGDITETLPPNFFIIPVMQAGGATGILTQSADAGRISWAVNLKKGDASNLSYFFRAPNVSPELYKVGPLQIGNWSEARQWQIAADATANTVVVIATTASTTWTVPTNWSSASNTIELIGAAGGGVKQANAGSGGGGGGGGAYVKILNWASSSAGSNVTIQIGAGGTGTTSPAASGTPTYFNGSGAATTCAGAGSPSACASPGAGGKDSGTTGAGVGGATSTSIGDPTFWFHGGTGGIGNGTGDSGGGGGGAAGPSGNGCNAGNAGASTAGTGGGGGGGGSCTASADATTTVGTQGGTGYGGAVGGAGASSTNNAGNGSAANGGGAGGGGANTGSGGAGASSTLWTDSASGATAGPGGGGGGHSNTTPGLGGAGGQCGGGGGAGSNTNGGTGGDGCIIITYTPLTITLASGTQPADLTIGPGAGSSPGAATTSNIFSFTTSGGTSTITQVTVSISTTTGIYQIQVTDNAGSTVYGSSTNPTASPQNIATTISTMNVSSSPTTFRVLVAPTSSTAMPAVPGALITVTSTVTGWIDSQSENQTGTDPTFRTLTIDNQSPNDVTNASGTPGATSTINLSWTTSTSADASGTLVLRSTSAISDTPVEGTWYAAGNTIGGSTVACVVASSTNPNNSCTDTGLVRNTPYYYKLFVPDAYANYSTPGVAIGPYTPHATTTLANGSNPAARTIGPGLGSSPGNATTSDVFSFVTTSGTSSITTVNVGLSTTTGIYRVIVANSTGGTVYGSSTNPVSTALAITTTNMFVSSTLTTFTIQVSPTSSTAMPAPPGALYVVTSTVTDWTDANNNGFKGGANTTSSIITIDNASPANVTNASGTAGTSTVSISWTNPADADFATTTVLRATSSISVAPTEGTVYTVGQSINTTTTVACVVASSTANCTDTGLTQGTAYYYKIFSQDNYANYATGTVPNGNPFTPNPANSPPSVSGVKLNHNGDIVLLPNVTSSFDINYTITDTNGCTDMNTNNMTSTAFRDGVSSTCAVPSPTTNNLNCYLYVTRATSTCSVNSINVTDTVAIWYFAQSTGVQSSSFPTGNWQAFAFVNDAANATGSATSSVAVNIGVLTAITVTTTTINYGTMPPGATTTVAEEQIATVQNVGNTSTTLLINGGSLTLGSDIFATSSQHYATSTFTFGGNEQQLQQSQTTVPGFFLTSPTSTTAVAGATYWGVQIPGSATIGVHTSTVTFSSQWSQ